MSGSSWHFSSLLMAKWKGMGLKKGEFILLEGWALSDPFPLPCMITLNVFFYLLLVLVPYISCCLNSCYIDPFILVTQHSEKRGSGTYRKENR